jgi:hypothetical protein
MNLFSLSVMLSTHQTGFKLGRGMILLNWQQKEPSFRKFIKLKEDVPTKPPRQVLLDVSQSLKSLWGLWDSHVIVENILYYKWKSSDTRNILLFVAPRNIRSKIFQELHENRTAGHLGRERTIKSIKRRLYWPGITMVSAM